MSFLLYCLGLCGMGYLCWKLGQHSDEFKAALQAKNDAPKDANK